MRVLEKCGFKKEAVRKKAVFKQGKVWNEMVYVKLIDG
jgi:RimJ/RimL family protein N-acetyltransferase